MSRALFVNLTEAQVIASCEAENVGISAIERIPQGGTRVVCMSVEGAGTMTRKFKGKLITEEVTRERHRPRTPLW
ncbi:hypothetical protein G7077_09260 [Sphingomonas piscis]|uniref:Uncharacterized protein n=1 Tax=Sphingomonas piscis TaxID=2714943 RepID=A0A6G7YQP0_9SPHN|nr:hypothetical protein [Sphingomonas piscis]QIK79052.1 hypothetical protein G7077_09260 [Sphingomonas piscis]